jgi:hypothetical protein
VLQAGRGDQVRRQRVIQKSKRQGHVDSVGLNISSDQEVIRIGLKDVSGRGNAAFTNPKPGRNDGAAKIGHAWQP